VHLAVNLNWHDVALVDGIKARLPKPLPVVLDNDVRVWAKSEMVFGTATEADSFIYIALGTGLGAAAIINGQPLMGSNGSAMELGHVIVQDDPRRRAEEFIAGLGMMQLYTDLVDQYPQSQFADRNEDVTTHMLLSHPDDVLTAAILNVMTRAFGQALAWVCTVLNPELIIVGGAFGQAIMPHIQDDLLLYIQKHTLPQIHDNLAIRMATITNGALGAACLLW
jgi:glucokinase